MVTAFSGHQLEKLRLCASTCRTARPALSSQPPGSVSHNRSAVSHPTSATGANTLYPSAGRLSSAAASRAHTGRHERPTRHPLGRPPARFGSPVRASVHSHTHANTHRHFHRPDHRNSTLSATIPEHGTCILHAKYNTPALRLPPPQSDG